MGNEQGRMLSPEELRAREISQMDSEMKKKLSGGGIKYNIKVVIKGDRNTGKTNLWRRLQGLSYQDAYIPTPEIQIATINWNYKVSDDIVKVEVWDVVDKAKPKKRQNSSTSLKLSNGVDEDDEDETSAQPPVPGSNQVAGDRTRTGSFAVNSLDANTVDVLRGAHAVIIMVDPTKKWTWDYAQREVPKIAAENIYTLVLANYRDMGEHRVVTEYEIKEFCKQQGDMVKCLEASMLNGYGLKSVVCFFNIPFLYMQRSYIQQQLDRNMEEIKSAEDELKFITKEQGYDFYLKWLNQNIKDKKARKQQQQQQATQPQVPQTQPQATSPPKPQEPAKQEPPKSQPPKQEAPKPQPLRQEPPKQPTPTPTVTPAVPTPAQAKPPEQKGSGFFSRIFSSNKPEEKKPEPVTQQQAKIVQEQKKIENVEEFAPADDLDDGFFGDEPSTPPPAKKQPAKTVGRPKDPEYSDDDDAPNPLVAKVAEDSDDDAPNPLVAKDEGGSDDDVPRKPVQKKAPPKKAAAPKTLPQKSPQVKSPSSEPKPVAKTVTAASEAMKASSPPVKQLSKQIPQEDSNSDTGKKAPAVKKDDFYSDDEPAPKAPAVKKDDFYGSEEDEPTPSRKPMIKKDADVDDDVESKPKKAPAAGKKEKKAPVVKRGEDEDEDEPTPTRKPTIKKDADVDDEITSSPKKTPVAGKKDKKAPVVKRDEEDEEDTPPRAAVKADEDVDVDDAFDRSSDSVRREELKGSSGSSSSRGERERRDRGERGDRGERRERGDRERRRRPEGERERRSRPEGERSRRPRRDEYEEPVEDNEMFSSTKITLSPQDDPHAPSPSSTPSSTPSSPPPPKPSDTKAADSKTTDPKSTDAFSFAPDEGNNDLDDFYND
eukprot:Phypoly_transcript_02237.p1 GENE.Phypoly_transcript_02237~~Phypoly_transcript_02237.p1  ORF type:complete len:879 (+),score=264.71 Phypoly_transcript_02237:115-2751(+)